MGGIVLILFKKLKSKTATPDIISRWGWSPYLFFSYSMSLPTELATIIPTGYGPGWVEWWLQIQFVATCSN